MLFSFFIIFIFFAQFFFHFHKKEQNLLFSLNLNVTKIKYISNIYKLNGSKNKELGRKVKDFKYKLQIITKRIDK